jgi:hypothetical protein
LDPFLKAAHLFGSYEPPAILSVGGWYTRSGVSLSS